MHLADYFRKKRENNAAVQSLGMLEEECDSKFRAKRNRDEARAEEQNNMLRLKSLLHVMMKEGSVPSCDAGKQNECTSASQGQCVFSKGGEETLCSCEWIYYGEDCNSKKCPGPDAHMLYRTDDRFACGGASRGVCDSTSGACECKPGFTGEACELAKQCPGQSQDCTGHGSCDKAQGKCTCRDEWFGKDCSKRMCPGGSGPVRYAADQEQACSGHGSCDGATGKCICAESFTGLKCGERTCLDECSGEGGCNKNTGECECNGGYQGRSCEFRSCAGGCGGSSSGVCDRDSGTCVCKEGYSGKNCGKSTTCNVQTTTLQDWAMFRSGWSTCPYGSFLTGLKTAPKVQTEGGESIECSSIECLQQARCSTPCFESTPVRYGHCYQANWWKSFNTAGWSKCRDPYYITGFYRNRCSSLYCIEVAQCCTVHEATYTQCGEHPWTNQLSRPDSWALVPDNRFITGLYRAGRDGTISDMTKAAVCNFEMTDSTE